MMPQISRVMKMRPLGLLILASYLMGSPDPADACNSSKPPPPFCGKTLVLAKAVPGVVLLPAGGGTFSVPALVFFNLVDFPPGTGICPPGPYSVTVSLTATCVLPPSGAGMVTTAITTGFNTVTVPVTVGPGPARLCTITGTATVALADGMVLSAAGDTVVCIAEPAPGNPTLPRLDMQLLGSPGSEIARVHPGDQAAYTYRITNNDPMESFSGELTVDMINAARLPGASGTMIPGTGVFSVSDPVEGDNFPIAFTEDLFEGCVLLPADPTNPAIPTLVESIDLDPGESIDIDVFSRPWGMCADGSCGEAKLVAGGNFSGGDPGLACAGFVTAADTSVLPTYQWPDSGEAMTAQPGPSNGVTLSGEPTPMSGVAIDFETTQAQLTVDGVPSPVVPGIFSDIVDPERGRIQLQFFDPLGFDVNSVFDIFAEIQVGPSPGQNLESVLLEMKLLPGAPTGFENLAPVGDGLLGVRQVGGSEFLNFTAISYQASAVGRAEVDDFLDMIFQTITITRTGDSTFELQLLGGQVTPGANPILQAIEISQDFRSFISEVPQGLLGELFTDGFESGDVSVWSRSVP